MRMRRIAFHSMVGIILSGLLVSGTVHADSEFRAIPGNSESTIAGVKIKYTRTERGCIKDCFFVNDSERCGDNAECCKKVAEYGDASDVEKCMRAMEDVKAADMQCVETSVPKIGDETIKMADNTISSNQVCDEFRIVAHGSPGWIWTCTGGSCRLVCIGYYYAPLQLCCDPYRCVKKP